MELLKARAKGKVPAGVPVDAVLGIVGVGGGGTAAVRYAALHPRDPLPFIATISARCRFACALRGTLTWSQLHDLEQDGQVVLNHASRSLNSPAHSLARSLAYSP